MPVEVIESTLALQYQNKYFETTLFCVLL